MIITPVRTPKIVPNQISLTGLLDENIKNLEDGSVVAVTSKIVSLCEGRIMAKDITDKDKLMRSEAELYYPAQFNRYRHHFTISRGTILGASGIDESNGGGHYVLLPNDVQNTANTVRQYMKTKFGLTNLGVIITDSASIPLRLGAVGFCLAYSGFEPIKDYRGTPDLFGREFKIERANMAEGLAAAAVLAMGEGDEQTPLCVISGCPLITFREDDPTIEELNSVFLSLDEDLFAPFIDNGKWQQGGRSRNNN